MDFWRMDFSGPTRVLQDREIHSTRREGCAVRAGIGKDVAGRGGRDTVVRNAGLQRAGGIIDAGGRFGGAYGRRAGALPWSSRGGRGPGILGRWPLRTGL